MVKFDKVKFDGTFDTSYYNTDELIEDLENYLYYGIVSARKMSGGGVEVVEERGDGTTRLNVYCPKPEGEGKYSHYWVDSDGKKYFRK